MINKPPPFKGLNVRIPIIIPIKGRGFINHGSGLGLRGVRVVVVPGFHGLGLDTAPTHYQFDNTYHIAM